MGKLYDSIIKFHRKFYTYFNVFGNGIPLQKQVWFLHTTATRIHKAKCVDLACHQQYRLYFLCSINFALITDLRTILERVYRKFAIICYDYIFDVDTCLFSPPGIKHFPVLSYFILYTGVSYFILWTLDFSVVSYFSIYLVFCRRSLFFARFFVI